MENDDANADRPRKSYRGVTYLRPVSGTMAVVVTAASVTGLFTGQTECAVLEEQAKVCAAEPHVQVGEVHWDPPQRGATGPGIIYVPAPTTIFTTGI